MPYHLQEQAGGGIFQIQGWDGITGISQACPTVKDYATLALACRMAVAAETMLLQQRQNFPGEVWLATRKEEQKGKPFQRHA